MKPTTALFSLALLCAGASFLAAADTWGEHVVVYDMKEDPTLPQFVGNSDARGFYGLVLDDDRGEGAVYYRVDEVLYRADFDMKIKGEKLFLKNGKRQKTLIRGKNVLPSGATQEVVYSADCPPEKGGWRRGPSFGRHVVRVNDEQSVRLIVGSAYLEFESALQKCGGPSGDCGDSGCPNWGGVVSTAVAKAGVSVSSTTPNNAVTLSLSRALLEGKSTDREILTNYKTDIDAVLPPKVNDLVSINTGYYTVDFPYPGMTDPSISLRGFKIGVIFKRYSPPDQGDPIEVDIEPLLTEFQAPAANKCGSWEAGPNRTIFDVRSRPALYVQTPGTGNTRENSSLTVCGQTVSVSVVTQSYRSKEDLSAVYIALPTDQMELVVGSGK